MQVTGGATISNSLTVGGITSSALIKSTAGMETTTFKASGAATFGSTIDATGKITGNGGLKITNGGNVTGTLTVDNLVVTGGITCKGNATFESNLGSRTITTTSTITADDAIRTKKAFHSTEEYIEFHWNSSPLHKLYVHGGSRSLEGGDAFIQTVS